LQKVFTFNINNVEHLGYDSEFQTTLAPSDASKLFLKIEKS